MDARKKRYDGTDALALLEGMDKLVAARGKKIAEFDLKEDRPSDEVLLAHLLGPTGNLRAPTARIGKTLLVGFNAGLIGKSSANRRLLPGIDGHRVPERDGSIGIDRELECKCWRWLSVKESDRQLVALVDIQINLIALSVLTSVAAQPGDLAGHVPVEIKS